jgi:hypothetical protein
MSAFAAFNHGFDVYQDTVKNITSARQAQERHKRDGELMELRKKKMEIELKEAERAGELSELQHQERMRNLKDQYSMARKEFEVGDNKINQTLHSLTERAKQVGGFLARIASQTAETGKGAVKSEWGNAQEQQYNAGQGDLFGRIYKDTYENRSSQGQQVSPELEAKAGQAVTSGIQGGLSGSRIKVIAPDGRSGWISKNKLKEAKKRGFQIVE